MEEKITILYSGGLHNFYTFLKHINRYKKWKAKKILLRTF